MNQQGVRGLPQGLVELVEGIDFIFEAVRITKEAKLDGGGYNWLDAPKVFGLFSKSVDAVEGLEDVPDAWAQATDAEKEVVFNYFAARFDLADDVKEAKVEKAVKAAYLLGDLFI